MLWLDQADNNASQLNQIYTRVLNRLLFVYKEGEEPKPISRRARSERLQILGAITILATPLPAAALAALLGMDPYDVNFSLRNLHAVLNIPSDPKAPVEMLHKSFSDFLLGQEGMGMDNFRVNAAEAHMMLASKCIDRMKRKDDGLRKNICRLQDYGKQRDEIDKAAITDAIPLDLEYSCLNWVYHLQQCRQHVTDEDKDKALLQKISVLLQEIETFIEEHFLHWIESLSLLGKLSECIISIRQLLQIVQVRPHHLRLHPNANTRSRNLTRVLNPLNICRTPKSSSLATARS
jgi:hypothetical protein